MNERALKESALEVLSHGLIDAERLRAGLAVGRERLVLRILNLEKQGLCRARLHFKQGKYAVLVHPQDLAGRRRDYVGCDAKKIEAVRAAIARTAEYDGLVARLNSIDALLKRCVLHLVDAFACLYQADKLVVEVLVTTLVPGQAVSVTKSRRLRR